MKKIVGEYELYYIEMSLGMRLRRKTKEKSLALINENPYITQKELREKLGLSQSGIEYQIRNMRKDAIICIKTFGCLL